MNKKNKKVVRKNKTRKIEKTQKSLESLEANIENSGNYSTNSQNSLMDNSEKRILINRIIHNKTRPSAADLWMKKDAEKHDEFFASEEERLKRKLQRFGAIELPQAQATQTTQQIQETQKIPTTFERSETYAQIDRIAHKESEKETGEKKVKEVEQELEKEFKEDKYRLLKKNEEILESYDIEVDGAKVKVEIKKDPMGVTYNVYLPKISPATATLLDEIRNELISITTISMQELTDPAAFSSIKERFIGDARNILREKLPNINSEAENFLVGILMQEMLGLGSIEFLINDPSLEEIVIPSAKENIRVYSKKYGWLLTNIRIEREEEIVNYSNIIARRVGRQITVLNPLLDAHLVTGDRVNAVLYPIGTKGNTVTIRKFSRDPFTMVDFINNKTCDINVVSLLWLAIEFEMNVLISGGTGSGKTSFLNACMPFIPPNQRILSIEDTRELFLPEFLYWTPLVTRTPNPEGKGEVSMLDLLVNSLRMRPDRIILGEMRRQQEAMVLFEAMHTGHSVYATVHADTAAETISRLINPPINVPPNLLKAVNLNVVMFRDRRKGIRRVSQIAEFEAEKDMARANILYRWVSEEDRIKEHSESSRFFEDLSRNIGMTESEINKNLEEKKKILSWLIKNKIRKLQDFGKIMNFYYKNKEFLLKAINKNDVKAILGG